MRHAIFLTLSILTTTLLRADEQPAVFWWSAPVKPGERVLIAGGAWGSHPTVELTLVRSRSSKTPPEGLQQPPDFKRAARVIPDNVTETGLCFEYPKDLPNGLVGCRVVTDTGASSEPFILNEPAVWWLQGDLGSDASPGGWLRLFGRCLDASGEARVVLVGQDRNCALPLTRRDTWSLDAQLPDDLPAGTYQTFVHNGAGGREGWRLAGSLHVRPYREVWKSDRFDVTAFGAVPNDGLDDTLALQAALAQAATNGGGIVYLPRGRFQCNGTLSIPERTLLRGESRESTSLYWPDCEEPPENLIEGTTCFGIEDVFIHAGKYRNGIVCRNDSAGQHALGGGTRTTGSSAHDITLRRVRLKLIIDQYILKNTAEYEKRAYLPGNGLVVRDARSVRVEDCDIYTSKEGSSTLFFILSADDLLVRNCRINGSGWAVVGGDRVIFENNDAYNCTYSIAPVCRNLFWSRNRQRDLFTNNRESITHDGARTAFRGIFPAACDGNRLAFDFGQEKISYRNGPDYWVGRNVQLIEGRGAGQTRTITALTNNVVTLDRPWSVSPDATSRFVIAAERQHLIYADNDTEDSSIAIQLYGGLTDGVLARNRSARSGGFRGFGMDYHAIIPLWYVQYIDNRIDEGNGYRGPGNQMVPCDSEMAFLDHGNGMTLTRSCVIRGGVLENNAKIVMSCDNGVIDGCVIRNADTGIVVDSRHAASIVLGKNRFENVAEPLNRVARQEAVMHPAERALLLLTAAEGSLDDGQPPPVAWAAIQRTLTKASGTLAARDPLAESISRASLLQALQALSASAPGHVWPMRLAEALLGASLRIRSWDNGMTRMLSSEAPSDVTVNLQASLAPAAPAARLSVTFDEIPGWQTPPLEDVALEAGKTVDLRAAMRSPAGAKGFFRMPVTARYSGDGWSLTCSDALETLTENRICQWVAAGGFDTQAQALANRSGWVALTNANVHGTMDLKSVLGERTNGFAAAVAVLRVTRPVALRFGCQGSVRLFADGRRIGADQPRSAWGSAAFAPGDHVLRAIVEPGKQASWSFKVFCDIPEACRPGDFALLPASEILRLGELP